jgi:His/Glu/Gln/Arg/opine family amino acid ABC transporter permease subunit
LDAVLNNLPLLLDGLWTTIRLALIGAAIALVLGLVVAMLRVSPLAPLRWIGTAYVEFVRNVPLLAHLFFWVYGLPFVGILLPEFIAAFCGLGVYTAAFVAEAVRAGIQSVGRPQVEAARALGLSCCSRPRSSTPAPSPPIPSSSPRPRSICCSRCRWGPASRAWSAA